MTSFFDFFTDPILAAPMWATMLMCLASSVMGVLIVVRRRALLGEAISHTTYPGIALMVYFVADYFSFATWVFPVMVIAGAFISAIVGMKLIAFLERSLSVSADSALCFVLSTFLGIGVLLASRLQFSHPVWLQKIQMFLYGQAATITTGHVWIYGVLTTLIVAVLLLFFPVITATFFDREYAKIVGVKTRFVGALVQVLLIFSIVIGIRSVGVLMMAGMLIAPAAAARMVTSKFSHLFFIAAIFGVISGMLGNMASVLLSEGLMNASTNFRITFPTGPMILIVAVSLAMVFLLFARKKGLVWRLLRRKRFRRICTSENILKLLYKNQKPMSLSSLQCDLGISKYIILRGLLPLYLKKMATLKNGEFVLEPLGALKARRIIRVHRLWEVYLVSELGLNAASVHHSAEEMEHIITPEIEEELMTKLGNPTKDPHDQMIPHDEVE